MDTAKVPEIIPDGATRTSVCGALGRLFWNIASDSIFRAMQSDRADFDAELPDDVIPVRFGYPDDSELNSGFGFVSVATGEVVPLDSEANADWFRKSWNCPKMIVKYR